jgi:hypothetical protein
MMLLALAGLGEDRRFPEQRKATEGFQDGGSCENPSSLHRKTVVLTSYAGTESESLKRYVLVADENRGQEIIFTEENMTLDELDAKTPEATEQWNRIARDSWIYTVTLFALSTPPTGDVLTLAGTGTLIAYKDGGARMAQRSQEGRSCRDYSSGDI